MNADPLYSWLPNMPTFGLTRFERTMLTVTGGMALDYATHTAAIRYVGMPARTLAAYGVGVTASVYLAGMGASYMINEDEGVADYRYAVDSIVTGKDGGLRGRVNDSILNVSLYVAPIVDDFIDDVEYVGSALYMQGKHLLRSAWELQTRRFSNDLPL